MNNSPHIVFINQNIQNSPGILSKADHQVNVNPIANQNDLSENFEVLLTYGSELQGGEVSVDGEIVGTAKGFSFLLEVQKHSEPYVFTIKTNYFECTEVVINLSSKTKIPMVNCKKL